MTEIRSATLADVPYLVSLHKKLAEYLGFFPRHGYEKHIHQIKIAVENGDSIGFAYAGELNGIMTFHQVGVQDDARRLSVGTELVDVFIAGSSSALARCRVRDTIPDRDFWPNIGFTEPNRVPSIGQQQRGKELLVYRRELQPSLF